jgi:hypothetical protein
MKIEERNIKKYGNCLIITNKKQLKIRIIYVIIDFQLTKFIGRAIA